MIAVHNLSFSYGKKPVLQDITLDFQPGKLYCILGPNGSGKTTLVKLLSRQLYPKCGSLCLEGTPYSSWGRKDFARRLALLPQGRNTPNTSAFDLVCCGRFPYLGLSRRLTREDLDIVQTALTQTGTEKFANSNVKQLSGGERQKVYLAMLCAQDTPCVLLDEPITHLDMAAGFQILEQLKKMKQQGKCVIAVLHDLSLALKYADEIILMHQGKAIAFPDPEDLLHSGQIEAAFGITCTPVTLNGETEYIIRK